ncbi:hypothetical protein EES37_33525 [Streptomyces sp. ADI91-18]|nr:hypothetical protein EES37_33525 [Streptomyces sp. ADI91-18]
MELDRVADEVLPEHAHLGGVGDQGRQRVVRDLRTGLLDADAEGGHGPVQHRLQLDALELVVDAADAGEVEEVVDERLHAVRAVDRVVDVLIGTLVELSAVAALEELREAGDLAQGLLQVVGGDVRELLQLGVRALQIGRLRVQAQAGLLGERQLAHEAAAHEVDLAAEAAQVGGTGGGDGVLEGAGGDGAGVRAELLQGAGDAAAQPFEDQHGEGGDDQGDRGEHPVPQGHGVREVLNRPGPVRAQAILLAGQGDADGVEGFLAFGGALGDQGRGRSGG